jgi:DNA-binding CsgD family transcriptional regulator
LSEIGIDRVVYSLMTDHDSLGLKAGHGILGTYPDDWMKYYFENGYVDIDPARKFIMLARKPFLWSELTQNFRELDKKEALLMNQANEAMLLDGVGLGIQNNYNEIVGMGFASSSGGVELDQNTLDTIHLLAHQFHTVFCRLEANDNFTREVPRLTEREREVLCWVRAGKSASCIATILGISEPTVRYHILEARKKLKTGGLLSDVLKAVSLGIIPH